MCGNLLLLPQNEGLDIIQGVFCMACAQYMELAHDARVMRAQERMMRARERSSSYQWCQSQGRGLRSIKSNFVGQFLEERPGRSTIDIKSGMRVKIKEEDQPINLIQAWA